MTCSYCSKELQKYCHIGYNGYNFCDYDCLEKHLKEEQVEQVEYYKKQEYCNHIYGFAAYYDTGLIILYKEDNFDEFGNEFINTYCPRCGKKL